MTVSSELALAVDEVWDVNEAIRELEARRDKLRAGIMASCRAEGIEKLAHARGDLRIQRYKAYRIEKPSRVLDVITSRGWADEVLSVRGRPLYKLAWTDAEARSDLALFGRAVQHESLVLTPRKK